MERNLGRRRKHAIYPATKGLVITHLTKKKKITFDTITHENVRKKSFEVTPNLLHK